MNRYGWPVGWVKVKIFDQIVLDRLKNSNRHDPPTSTTNESNENTGNFNQVDRMG